MGGSNKTKESVSDTVYANSKGNAHEERVLKIEKLKEEHERRILEKDPAKELLRSSVRESEQNFEICSRLLHSFEGAESRQDACILSQGNNWNPEFLKSRNEIEGIYVIRKDVRIGFPCV